MFRLVGILMRAAPIGAFGAMAFTIGKYGIGTLANLGELLADLLSDLADLRSAGPRHDGAL